MDKKLKIYIGVLLLIITIIMYVEATKTKQINWFPTYAAKHKIPYGTYVLRKELKSIFPKTTIKEIHKSPYLFLKDTTQNGTYFFVDGNINFDKDEFNEILSFVNRGNDVFIATNGIFIDTLGLKTKRLNATTFNEDYYHRLVNKHFPKKTYHFNRDFSKIYFSKIDTLQTKMLGEIILNDDGVEENSEVNFIKVPFGKGHFLLHTFPEAFTNYNMLLNDNHEYVSSVLSYLNSEKPIFWDAYYKTGKSKITSPMHYLLNSKYLKWAYYFALIGVLFFIVFKGKRTQRVIPIITPLKNQTLAFTQTIANMYYEKSEHKNIANHKINYFLDYVRLNYKISTLKIDEEFYKNLANRSANSVDDVRSLFNLIEKIQKQSTITKQDLIALNTAIEKFKKQHT